MSVKIKSIFRTTLLLCLLLVCGQVSAQTTAKGTVTDATGEPVIGATVVEKGNAKNAAVTDFDGNFTLKLQKSKTIVVSYIGMVTQEVTATGGDLKITLQDDNASLEEVVVVGYTSKARKDLTGSVGSVSGAKLAVVPVSSAAEALQGKIAGVQITTTDGQPGADINIRVRGATSVTSENRPLFIIDGFEADNINDIPPTDIASIDVLKDASLTAIYGARGGNGVVVVTTKSAQAGKVQVSFNGRLQLSHISKTLDLMNTQEFVRYQWDRAAAGSTRSNAAKYFRGNFGNRDDMDVYSRAITHDWQDEVMGDTPLSYSANVTVGGGNDKLRFNISATQSDDRGIIMDTGVRRFNLNTKIVAQITKNLTLNYNPKFTYRRDIGAGGSRVGTGGIIDVLRYRPTNGLREFAWWDPRTVDPDDEAIFAYTNPVSDIGQNQRKQHQYSYVNQVSLDWKPIKGLTLKTDFAHSMSFRDNNQFYGFMTKTGQSNNNLPVANITNRRAQSYTWTNTAAYDLTIKDNHNLSFLLGQEIHDSQYKQDYMQNRYFGRDISAQEAWNNMTLGNAYQSTSALSTSDRMASFFGQASYNYMHKYLLSVTMRADGSTYFAPGNQWGYFPSVSAGWVISQEKFMKNVKWVNNLKLRFAIGLSGNNRIGADRWRYLYAINATGGPGFGESTTDGEKFYASSDSKVLPNPDIKWETTLTRNLAMDISLFDSRLTITPEIYWNRTYDLLYDSPIPFTTGFETQTQNIGEVSNKGWELTVNGDILRGKDYVLSANFTLGHNKMIVEKLNGTVNILYNTSGQWSSSTGSTTGDYQLKVGQELGQFWGFVYDGLYRFDEFEFDSNQNFLAVPKEGTVSMDNVMNTSNSGNATLPGKIKFKDLNGDGIIDDNDKTVIGNTNPAFQGGFGLSGQWKNFDFTANFTYMLDFDLYNATAFALSSAGTTSNTTFTNVLSDFKDGWTYTRPTDYENLYKNYYDDGATDEYMQLNANRTLWNPADINNNALFSYFVEDGSFLRCSDITLGYTFPSKLTKKAGLSKVRLYLSTSNLFIITNYSGYDPEVDIQTGLAPNMDYNRYPRSRNFVFGANINF